MQPSASRDIYAQSSVRVECAPGIDVNNFCFGPPTLAGYSKNFLRLLPSFFSRRRTHTSPCKQYISGLSTYKVNIAQELRTDQYKNFMLRCLRSFFSDGQLQVQSFSLCPTWVPCSHIFVRSTISADSLGLKIHPTRKALP